jgi:hypothetical protein
MLVSLLACRCPTSDWNIGLRVGDLETALTSATRAFHSQGGTLFRRSMSIMQLLLRVLGSYTQINFNVRLPVIITKITDKTMKGAGWVKAPAAA